jgi:predicted DNA-binding transcriptional regulator YafY
VPVADSASTSRRLLALLSLLQARRDWPARVLAERLGVSERTVRRDVERLRDLDYAIDATRGPDGGYRLGAGERMPPLLLDEEQAVAVALALRTAASVGAAIAEPAERALEAMTRMLPAALAARVRVFDEASAPAPPVATDPAVLVRLGDAIRDRVELRFDYASVGTARDPAAPPRRIEPHHLVLHGGRWYLIGFDVERDDWRTLRVDRLVPKSHGGRRFAARVVPGGDPLRFLEARFRGSDTGTWACWGEATLPLPARDVAPYVVDGTALPLEPGLTRVRLGAWSWTGVAVSLLRFDADPSDVEPPELRAALATVAARAGAASTPSDTRSGGVTSTP